MSKTRLKELREEKGLHQVHVAKELDVSEKTISNWETGYRQMDTDTVLKLCAFFGVTADFFLRRTEY